MLNHVRGRFDQVAATHPNAPAVVDPQRTLTFTELQSAAKELARRIMWDYGVGPESPVALHMERSCLMVVSIMGVVFARGCYVPIEIVLPERRKLDILEDALPSAILVTDESALSVPTAFRTRCCVVDERTLRPSNSPDHTTLKDLGDEQRASDTSSASSSQENSDDGEPSPLLYIFYTSGSTGKPKGVMVEHAALVHRIDWLQAHHTLCAGHDSVLQKTSYGFGISEWEIFWPLLTGAAMVLAKPEGHKDPGYLCDVIASAKISVLFFVPSMLDALLDESSSRAPLPSVKYVFCCGEPLMPKLCRRFHEPSSGFNALMCNLYGPTEADMTAWYVPPRGSDELESLASVPIGSTIDDCDVIIAMPEIESVLEPLPTGTLGEICFDSVGTTRGYLNLPELTAKVVLPSAKGEGRRVFRTGDLGRWTRDGVLEYAGRKDRQIKLRGIRIELGEIEAALRADNAVREAYVKVDGEGPAQRLVAYVSPRTRSVAEVEAGLKTRVPAAYVPSCFVQMEYLPRTVNGKVDKNALPAPPSALGRPADVLPRTEVEAQIEQIWATVLNAQPNTLDVHQDFEILGGNSLLAGRATGLLRQAFPHARIEGTAMYRHSSIEKMAKYIELRKKDGSNGSRSGAPSAKGYRGRRACGCIPFAWQTLVIALLHPILVLNDVSEVFIFRFASAYLDDSGFLSMFLLAISIDFLVDCFELVTCLAVQYVAFPCGLREGHYPLWGWTHMRWWAVSKVHHLFMKDFNHLGGTPMVAYILRLFGAKVGRNANFRSMPDFDGPSARLVTIGDNVTVQYGAQLSPVAIENGELIVKRVVIEDHAEIGARACMTPGTTLPHHSRLQGNCTPDEGAFPGCITPREETKPVSRKQYALRILVGQSLLVMMNAVLVVISFALVDIINGEMYDEEGVATPENSLFGELLGIPAGIADGDRTIDVTPSYCMTLLGGTMVMAFIFTWSFSEGYFFMVVLIKFFFLGYAQDGDTAVSEWAHFRLWLLERFAQDHSFEDSLETWRGTELLSIKYRLLGMSVGRRVQMDNVYVVEPELLEVGDYALFGNSPCAFNERVMPNGDITRQVVRVHDNASVLDLCLLYPGSQVMAHAMLGSSTTLGDSKTMPEGAIATGCVDGTAVILKTRGPEHRQPKTPEEITANYRHTHGYWWLGFNVLTVLAGVIVAPLEHYAPYLSTAITALIFFREREVGALHEEILYVLIALPCVAVAVNTIHVLLAIALKWIIIGRYKEQDQPFYSAFHAKWAAMMIVGNTFDEVQTMLDGSVYNNMMHRALGCKVGADAYLSGRALEFDLLQVGEGATIGEHCCPQAHTVERFVIRFATITLAPRSTMRANSVVMPGAILGESTSLREGGLLLKGEATGVGEIWVGNPASRSVGLSTSQANSPRAGATSGFTEQTPLMDNLVHV